MSDSTNANSGEPGRVNDGAATGPQDDAAAQDAANSSTPGEGALTDADDQASDAPEETAAVEQEAEAEDVDGDDAAPEVAAAAPAVRKSSAAARSTSAKPASRAGAQASRPAKKPAPRGAKKQKNVFARIVLFVRQVIAELKKVVRPTRSELFTYTAVVLVFVLVIMAYVGVLDFAFGKLVLWAFGS